MAIHSSTVAWKIPWTEEPGRLQSMGSQRVRHNWATSLSLSLELNSPVPVHFSSLIPRMSTFSLAISCLTTSNLLWFMDLTCQVPMQYCSLKHRTLLLSPVISTTEFCFCFGSIPSFFLELFSPLISSSILGIYRPGEFLFQYPIILPFHTVHGVLKARILK